jgi:threonine synthase
VLYVTTRNDTDVYTAQRVLRSRRGPDGGLFIPFRLSRLSREEVLALGQKSFGSCVAQALNLFFNTRLTGFDVDLAAGRYCVRLEKNNQRIILAECWHNPSQKFERLISGTEKALRQSDQINRVLTSPDRGCGTI